MLIIVFAVTKAEKHDQKTCTLTKKRVQSVTHKAHNRWLISLLGVTVLISVAKCHAGNE